MKRGLLALLGALSVCAASTGAAAVLGVVPQPIVAGAGALCILLARPRSRNAVPPFAAALAAGALLGLSLPSRPMQVNHVLTRSAGVARSGDVFALLDRIDANPRAVLGRKESVSGQWSTGDARRPPTVSRRVMTCCAADAIDIGFDVYELHCCPIASGALVRVTGLVDARVRDGELRYGLVRARVTVIREHGSSRCVAIARRSSPAALRARRQRGQEPTLSATRGGSRPAGR